MARIVQFHETGGPEVLKIKEVAEEPPAMGEVRMRVQALGINRAEVMLRQGAYAFAPTFPCRIGVEAAGEVESVGPGVRNVRRGERVVSTPYPVADRFGNWTEKTNRYGVYGETALVPALSLWHYPSNISPVQASASSCQYLTAWGGLVHHAQVGPEDTVLVTAASSSAAARRAADREGRWRNGDRGDAAFAKTDQLRTAGTDHAIAYQEEPLVDRVLTITDGRGATIVYDPIGGNLMRPILEAVAPEARIVNYGNLAPENMSFNALDGLIKRIELKFHSLYDTSRRPDALALAVAYVSERLADGRLVPIIDSVFEGLESVIDAHRRLESNQQFGKIVVDLRA